MDGYNKLSGDSETENTSGSLTLNDDPRLIRRFRLLIVISVFYITLGTFIMGLVITQSIVKDFKL